MCRYKNSSDFIDTQDIPYWGENAEAVVSILVIISRLKMSVSKSVCIPEQYCPGLLRMLTHMIIKFVYKRLVINESAFVPDRSTICLDQ